MGLYPWPTHPPSGSLILCNLIHRHQHVRVRYKSSTNLIYIGCPYKLVSFNCMSGSPFVGEVKPTEYVGNCWSRDINPPLLHQLLLNFINTNCVSVWSYHMWRKGQFVWISIDEIADGCRGWVKYWAEIGSVGVCKQEIFEHQAVCRFPWQGSWIQEGLEFRLLVHEGMVICLSVSGSALWLLTIGTGVCMEKNWIPHIYKNGCNSSSISAREFTKWAFLSGKKILFVLQN